MLLYLKLVTILPLRKSPGLDMEDIKTYRIISRPTFNSKHIEKVVASRTEEHLKNSDLHDRYKVVYRASHSTETALLKVYRDIADDLNEGSMLALNMFYLSTTFDVIDHQILSKRVEHSLVINEQSWVKSYLGDRTNDIPGAYKTSPDVGLHFGAPQGCVIVSNKCCTHTKPIGKIIN